ncbi:MAG TPA: hypothetical protein VI413_07650, partial [Paludibacter sp.]
YLNEQVKDIDSQTYFIGHSVGCQAVFTVFEQTTGIKKGFTHWWLFICCRLVYCRQSMDHA